MMSAFWLKCKAILEKKSVQTLIFGIIAVLNILYVFDVSYILSLDGPQHIYNSQLLLDLLNNNPASSKFYEINDVLVGYWFTHALFSFFNLLFSASVAEKLLITTIAVGMPFAFLYFIRSIKANSGLIIVLIFPFAIHKFLILGYYPFSMAWIFFFITIGYFIRIFKDTNYKKIIILGLLLLLTFFTHMIIYSLTVSFIGIFVLVDFFSELKKKSILSKIKGNYKFWLLIFIAAIPSLILAVNYYLHVQSINPVLVENKIPVSVLSNGLLKLDILVAFHHGLERAINIPLFYVLLTFFIFGLFIFIKSFFKKNNISSSERTVAITSLLLISVFIIFFYSFSDAFGTGSIKFRLLTFVLFLVVLFISIFKYKWYFQLGLVSFIIWYIFSIQAIRRPFYRDTNKSILEIKILESKMMEDKTFFTINANPVWNNPHIGMYAGSDKSLINLNNPQCMGHFPIVYNWDSMPVMYAGTYSNKQILKAWWYTSEVKDREIKIIDYIIVYNNYNFIHATDFEDARSKIFNYYNLVEKDSNNIVGLYQFNGIEKFDSVYNKILNDSTYYDLIKVKSIAYDISFENAATICAVEMFRKNPIDVYGVDYYIGNVKKNPEWYAYAQEQATKKGITIEQSIIDEATYRFNTSHRKFEEAMTNTIDLDFYIRSILSNPQWKNDIYIRSQQLGLDFHQMIVNDAKYMYNRYLEKTKSVN